MKISIITVTYNSEKTIVDTIESINSQTYSDIEHIIIDGGSKDRTLDIIRSKSNRILKVISEPDDGIYDAMNKGIQNATGEIIGILNSDDFLASPYVIEKIVQAFEKEKCDAVYGNLDFVSSQDSSKIIRHWVSSPFIRGSFVKGWTPPHPTFYVRREVYEKYGLFDKAFKISADFELMLRFIEIHQIKVYYVNETFVRMRYGGESTGSLKKIIKGNLNIIKAFNKNGIKISIFYPLLRLLPKIKEFSIK